MVWEEVTEVTDDERECEEEKMREEDREDEVEGLEGDKGRECGASKERRLLSSQLSPNEPKMSFSLSSSLQNFTRYNCSPRCLLTLA